VRRVTGQDDFKGADVQVAALYVETNGVYYGLPGVDPWDEQRDARLYAGPWPVVAHPPCSHWCQLASVNAARYETFKIGDDGGCFAAALHAVETFGGVLEHPAYSLAWEGYGLPRPGRGGWTFNFFRPGCSIEVSQSAYGHQARKRTWLYYVGASPPPLRSHDPRGVAMIGNGIYSGEGTWAAKLSTRVASATPEEFRDVLLDMARSARVEAAA
jgi:hypothetical protein